jgi:hypothetical protein
VRTVVLKVAYRLGIQKAFEEAGLKMAGALDRAALIGALGGAGLGVGGTALAGGDLKDILLAGGVGAAAGGLGGYFYPTQRIAARRAMRRVAKETDELEKLLEGELAARIS